jgi:hypothetical protein
MEEENSIPPPLKNPQEPVENVTTEVEGPPKDRWRSFSLKKREKQFLKNNNITFKMT